MVRGVNKQIIEVVDTGSEHFERAILFVHPDSGKLGGDQLANRAKNCLRQLRLRPQAVRRRRWPLVLAVVAAFALGVSAGMLLFPLLV